MQVFFNLVEMMLSPAQVWLLCLSLLVLLLYL